MLTERTDRVKAERRRWKPLVLLAVVALALHAAVLIGVAGAGQGTGAARQPTAMLVRTLPPEPEPATSPAAEPPPEPLAEAERPAPTPVRVEPVVPVAPVVRKAAPLGRPPEPLAAPTAPDVAVAVLPVPPPAASDAAWLVAEQTLPPPAPEPGPGGEIELYRTRIPPDLTLRYELRRGGLRGEGELQWRADTTRYTLKLQGRALGFNILTQSSEGGFDDAGLSPLRFTDQRANKAMLAANFQRGVGRLSYSGTTAEFGLLPGAQDRLSWMIQLAAIVAASPQHQVADTKVTMYVTGARGDFGAWVFRAVGSEVVELEGGPVQALKFVREPRGEYDTRVEVWLDLARHALPVRARLQSGAGDAAFELRLRQLTLAP